VIVTPFPTSRGRHGSAVPLLTGYRVPDSRQGRCASCGHAARAVVNNHSLFLAHSLTQQRLFSMNEDPLLRVTVDQTARTVYLSLATYIPRVSTAQRCFAPLSFFLFLPSDCKTSLDEPGRNFHTP
jgi:hypothetical protein